MAPSRSAALRNVFIAFFVVGLGAALLPWALRTVQTQAVSDKVYVAEEGSGSVAVINVATNTVQATIPLATSETAFMAHNVQVAPDQRSVWVTANAMAGMDHSDMASHGDSEPSAPDALIVLDPRTDTIIRRIPIAAGLHLAHVVLTPDSAAAIAVAQEAGKVFKIDAKTYAVSQTVDLPAGSQPHGLRITPNGTTAYIALMGSKTLGVLDLATFTITYQPLGGVPVQTAVTPDGAYAAASLFDTKQLALYDVARKEVHYVALPAKANGPLQIYPSPDSQRMYVADQGNYFGQPDGSVVYVIDIATQSVTQTIAAGTAPHGVVVSPDGRTLYVTNLVSNDVSVIDTQSGREIARIPTGSKPNGISYWQQPAAERSLGR